MGKLICLVGPDGAGKGTQLELIKNYLKKSNLKFDFFHFPAYGDNEFSEIIAQYLRGEYGNINDVNPYFIANIYAMDRYLFLPKLQKMLNENDIVILDRYVQCNMAFQGAKYEDNSLESEKIQKWIYNFEFNFLKLPYPDLVIYFNLPIEVIKERLEKTRSGSDRDYLNGKKDIHEMDLQFQERVNQNYLKMSYYKEFKIIDCVNTFMQIVPDILNGIIKTKRLLTPDELFMTYKKDLDNIIQTLTSI